MKPLQGTITVLLQRYFCQYLLQQRNVSPQTIASYRDAFRLLLRFLQDRLKKLPTDFVFADLNADNIAAFLHYVEHTRGNTIRTRNVRLAAIRSFLKFALIYDPTALPFVQQVMGIPMKLADKPVLSFLSREEMTAIIKAPDSLRWSGQRDRVLFATMYNSGARVSEITAARVGDVSLTSPATLRLYGKGRKQRVVPLWRQTARQLHDWIKKNNAPPEAPLFPNAAGGCLSRSGVARRLTRAVRKATASCPSLSKRAISPHTIRHTTAMDLLQAGVDITVIALWLGHEDIETTHCYVQANLAMKEKALDMLQPIVAQRGRYQPKDDLLAFLDRL